MELMYPRNYLIVLIFRFEISIVLGLINKDYGMLKFLNNSNETTYHESNSHKNVNLKKFSKNRQITSPFLFSIFI